MTRAEILDTAKSCVCGQREQDYGKPEDNFARIADLWTALMGHDYTPVDVALMMACLKMPSSQPLPNRKLVERPM